MDGRAAASINRTSAWFVVGFALIALLTIGIGLLQHALVPRAELCQPDEGTLAHIFQLSVVALVPAVAVFVLTGDWTVPATTIRPLVVSAVALALAFSALYYGEHHVCGEARAPRGDSRPSSIPASRTPPGVS